MSGKKVSIVIVNYNGKDLLQPLFNSIFKSTYENYEIIVVDNNSTDGSQQFIKKSKNIKLIENKKNLGYSGINSAIRYCKGDYILFLNNDMEIDKKCIGFLVKTLESDQDIAMVAPKLVNYYDKKLKSGGTWVSRAFYNGHIKGKKQDTKKEIPYLGVGLIRKSFVDNFNYLFDPDYFIYAEDLDLGLRIRLNHKKLVFEPNALLQHMHAITTKKSSKAHTTYLMERNLLITFFKILSVKNIILFFPYVLIMRLLAIFRDLITLNITNALSRTKAILWIIFHVNLIHKKRKTCQKLRKAEDQYILKVFSENYMFKKPFIV